MTVSQISVFTESKPGHLANILNTFKDASVSVRGYAVSDTGDYGIARFVVDRPDDATAALKASNFAFTVTQVLCLKLEDKPGELARIMDVFARCGINISYSYSMISTYIVINAASDINAVKDALDGEPVEMVCQGDLDRM